jgi:hypothetical protein
LSASLAAAADCASRCASTPSAALQVNSAAMPCGHCVPQHRPASQQKNRNCGQHCLNQAIPGKISIQVPQTSLHAMNDLLSADNSPGFGSVTPDPAPANSESHPPPARSGRNICRHNSLLRI